MKTLVNRFVKVPTDVKTSEALIALGYFTKEELFLSKPADGKGKANYRSSPLAKALQNAARTSIMVNGSDWPKVKDEDGNTRVITGFSWALSDEEYAMYMAYYHRTHPGTRTTTTVKMPNDRALKAVEQIRAYLMEHEAPQDLLDDLGTLESLVPVPKCPLLQEMFNVSHVGALKGKVNLAYVMFRGPNGEFSEDLQPSMVDLVTRGFMPKYTKDLVKSNLAKLKAKGIIMDGCIVDL